MRVLAGAPASEIARLCAEFAPPSGVELLRGPETGQITVRGRIGGGGAPFNIGEATVTRATVRLPGGEVGHAYTLGRDGEKARLIAIVDALIQRPGGAREIEAAVLAPLRAAAGERARKRHAEAAATKVDFFTMVRGED